MWIDKQRNIIGFTLCSLLRKKGKNITLLTVYTVIVFLLASVMFFTQSIKQEATVLVKGAPEIMVQRLMAGRHDLIPSSYIEIIQKIKGVQDVQGRLWGYYSDPGHGGHYTLVVDGNLHSQPGSITIGNDAFRNLIGKEQGAMPFKTHNGGRLSLKIKTILSPKSERAFSHLILVSEEDFRKVFGTSKDYFSDLTVHVRNIKELTTIAEKIVNLLPDTRPILREEILRTYEAVFDWRGGLLIVIFLGSLLAFIIFAWDKAAGLSAEERREIGILKALGWETSDVLFMKFWEGAAVSLASFLSGILLAYGQIFFTSSTVFEPALKGWSVLYPGFKLTPLLDAYQVATLFFLTVIPYTVATLIPSWRAATIDPDLVMRM